MSERLNDQRLCAFLENGSSRDMNVDGSVTAVDFVLQALTVDLYIESINVYIRAGTATDHDLYGDVDLSAGKGVQFKVRRFGDPNSVKTDLDGGHSIKSTSDWLKLTPYVLTQGYSAADPLTDPAQNVLHLYADHDPPSYLHVPVGFEIVITISDDLTKLEEHTCFVKGRFGDGPH